MLASKGPRMAAVLGGGRLSKASRLLIGEDDGLAIDFTDLSIRIKDTATPANNFKGNVNSKLTYTSPSTKYIRTASGISDVREIDT